MKVGEALTVFSCPRPKGEQSELHERSACRVRSESSIARSLGNAVSPHSPRVVLDAVPENFAIFRLKYAQIRLI